ncbi:MAG: hypothetical protein ACTSV5_11530 [Promethearchaeota archaeon]
MLSKQRVSIDMVKKNHSKKFILIHFWAYSLFTSITVVFVMFKLFPIYPIFLITSMVWLIGLSEHFAAYRMKSRDVYPRARRGFYYNLAAFLGSLPLIGLSFYVFMGIPITIWGIILVIQYVLYHMADTESRENDIGNVSVKNFNGFSEESLRIIALKKVRFRLSLQIHSGIYLGVNLFITIFFTSPYIGNLFFELIFASVWFIFLSLHGTAYLIYAHGVYPKVKRGYYYNLFAFLASIPFQLTTMSVIILGPFWGILVIIHYMFYRIISRKSNIKEGIKKTHLQRLVEKEMEKMKRLL